MRLPTRSSPVLSKNKRHFHFTIENAFHGRGDGTCSASLSRQCGKQQFRLLFGRIVLSVVLDF